MLLGVFLRAVTTVRRQSRFEDEYWNYALVASTLFTPVTLHARRFYSASRCSSIAS